MRALDSKVRVLLLALQVVVGLVACMERPAEPTAAERVVALRNAAERDRSAGKGEIILLGSSTIARITSTQLPNAVNLGVGGDTLSGLTNRIASYRSLPSADAIILLIGLNDLLSKCQVAGEEVESLSRALPPNAAIIWVGVQGVSPQKRSLKCDGKLPELTLRLNETIRRSCESRPRCRYVPNPIPEGIELRESERLHEADGIHLSQVGYSLLLSRLVTALEPREQTTAPNASLHR